MRRLSNCPSGLPFFGLTSEYRVSVYTVIHEIVFHGNGGYSWNDVYSMPIWLRKFTFEKIREFYEEQNKANSKKTTPQTSNRPMSPNVDPTYKSRASSK